ncbi:hypothetical protein LEP1GSC050_3214 [Leptospira broomii serovar Hurstbridge str. 5399]|uniref:Uncharacterized protein n=1 Tax=Leptospira broomii serovar Hurstbridge str. 5399 TaxID=1049789 RepID=T0GES5_9LEPT|nr:hypothetical protein LEP1GSC050_3214 [Leptospira broomii serovar Hurstbridge str. 5399]
MNPESRIYLTNPALGWGPERSGGKIPVPQNNPPDKNFFKMNSVGAPTGF